METLTDPAEIAQLLSECTAEEQQLEEQIRAKFEAALNDGVEPELLDAVEGQLEHTAESSVELLRTISDTCSIAERVSSQVRELDISRTRLEEVQRQINQVADRKDAAEALAAALASDNFEAAAAVARRFNLAVDVGLPTDLVDGIERFGTVMAEKLAAAEAGGSTNEVLRFAKLLPPLQTGIAADQLAGGTGGVRDDATVRASDNGSRSGSTVYAQHLRQLVATVSKEHRSHLSKGEASGDPMIYISVLSAIFEVVASVIHDHSPIILESFGQLGLQLTLQELQLECDLQADKVIRSCVEKRGLKVLCQRVAGRGQEAIAGSGQAGNGSQRPPVDQQEVSSVLDELALISDRTEKYEAFIAEQLQCKDGTRRRSGLREMVQETIGHYIALEAYLVDLNCARAMEVDEMPSAVAVSEQPSTSSVVDEVFFILKSTLQRALTFTNEDALAAVLNHVMATVEGNYRLYLAKQLDRYRESTSKMVASALLGQLGADSFSSSISSTFSSMKKVTPGGSSSNTDEQVSALAGAQLSSTADVRQAFAVYLNYVQVSCDYVGRLADDAARRMEAAGINPNGKCGFALEELAAANQLQQLLTSALSGLYGRIVHPRLKASASLLKDLELNIGDEEYREYEANDPFVSPLLAEATALLRPLSTQLTPTNFTRMVLLAAETVANRIESSITSKRYTQLGGLQLEKDIRRITSFFGDLTPGQIANHHGTTVRSIFSSVSLSAAVLAVYELGEAEDFVATAGAETSSRQTSLENVQRLLKLRVDFSPAAVSALSTIG